MRGTKGKAEGVGKGLPMEGRKRWWINTILLVNGTFLKKIV